MATSSFEPPPFPDDNRGPVVEAIMWTETGLAILTVALRFHVRRSAKSLAGDDWLMLLALAMLIAWTSLMTYYASWGGFRHMAYLPIPTQKDVIFWNIPIQSLSVLLFIPSKLSVAWLILRIIGPHMVWRRRVLLFLMATVFLFNSLLAIFLWVECHPIAAAWDYTIHGTCWSPGIKVKFGIFDSAWNIMVDIVLALMPATIIWQLKLPNKTRIGISILMSLGLLAAISGIIKTLYLSEVTAKSDLSWSMYKLPIWNGTEQFVIIFCGSIPPLKPFYDQHIKGLSLASLVASAASQRTRSRSVNSYALRSPSMWKTRHPLVNTTDASMTAIVQTRVVDVDVESARNRSNESRRAIL